MDKKKPRATLQISFDHENVMNGHPQCDEHGCNDPDCEFCNALGIRVFSLGTNIKISSVNGSVELAVAKQTAKLLSSVLASMVQVAMLEIENDPELLKFIKPEEIDEERAKFKRDIRKAVRGDKDDEKYH